MVRHGRLGAPKLEEREQAIDLRRKGRTYSEILQEVKVAKSTLSVWLGKVGLTEKQQQRITDKKLAAMRRGGAARRAQRLTKTHELQREARVQLKKYRAEALFIVGLALYWAEGSKQKEWSVSQGVAFSNMDVRTHQVVLSWIERYLGLARSELTYELYLHTTSSASRARQYWSTQLLVPPGRIRLYLKRAERKTVRHNTADTYFGVLRIRVPKSTDTNRIIAAWIENMIEYACT